MCRREIVKSSFMYCSKSVDATVNQRNKKKYKDENTGILINKKKL